MFIISKDFTNNNPSIRRIGIIIAFLTGFSINLSTSFQNIMVFTLVLSSFFHSNFNTLLKESLKNNFIKGALLFYMIFIIAVLWSKAPIADTISMLLRMILFLLCPLIYVFFVVRENVKAFFLGFALCVLISVFLSLFSDLSGLNFYLQNTGLHTEINGFKIDLFRGHTYQNYFSALLTASLIILILEGFITKRSHKIIIISLIAIIFVNVFFFVTGRTGHILYLFVLLIIALYYMNWKRIIIFTLILLSLSAIIIYSSSNIRSGISNAVNDIRSYEAGYANTSLGLRITFYKNSLKIISESPIIGHGTGSFKSEYEKLKDEVMTSVGNPHSDYLWFAAEIGLLGLGVFIGFLYLSLYQSFYTKMPYKLMATILIVTYIISSINNSFFTDNLTGQFFILALCALLSRNELIKTS